MAESLDMKITATLNADPAIKEAKEAGKDIEKALEIKGDKTVTHMQENLQKTVDLSNQHFETLKKTAVVLKENEKYTARKNELLEKQARLSELASDRERIASKIAEQRSHIRDLQESGTNEGWIKYNQNKLAIMYESLEKVNAEYAEVEKSAARAEKVVKGFETRGTTHKVVGTDFTSPEAEQALKDYIATMQQAKDLSGEVFEATKPGMADTVDAFKNADAETKDFFNDFMAKAEGFNARIKELGESSEELKQELYFSDDDISIEAFERISRESSNWVNALEKTKEGISGLGDSYTNLNLTEEQIDYLANVLDKLKGNAQSAISNFSALPQTINTTGMAAKDAIPALESNIAKLQEYRQQLAAVSETDPNFSKVKPMDDLAAQSIANYTAQLNELKAAAEDVNIPEKLGDENEIANIIARIRELKQTIKDIESGEYEGENATEAWVNAHVELAEAQARLKGYKDQVKDIVANTEEGEKATKSWSLSLKSLKDAFKNIHNIGGKAFKILKKQSHDLTRSLKHGARSVLKYVLGFKTLFYLVRKLRTAVKEGLENLVQFNSGANEVNTAISSLNTSLLYAKNAWAAAFSPIVTAVMPMITALIDKIAQLGNILAQFFGRLTGQSKVFQAVKVDAGNYAKSLDKTGKSAGSAAKKTKELNDRLAAFDDLNVLGKDKDPSSSGGGGGSGAGDLDVPSVDDMFTQIVPKSSLADMIREAWLEKGGDLSEVGREVANKIVEMLNNIPWDEIQAGFGKLGTAIGSFLREFINTKEVWTSVGSTIGETLNTVILLIHNFLTEMQGADWGGGLAEMIRSWLTTTDWGMLGSDISMFVTQLVTNIASFLENFPTAELFQAILDLLGNIDWIGVFAAIVRLLSSAISFTVDFAAELVSALAEALSSVTADDIEAGFTALFENFDVEKLVDVLGNLIEAALKLVPAILSSHMAYHEALWDFFKGYFAEVFEDPEALLWEPAKQVIGGLFEGLADGLSTLGQWINDNIFKPFCDFFCDLFGIHSPSTVFAEYGTFIIEGLLNGISSMIESIKEKWEEIKEAIAEKVRLIKTVVLNIWNSVKISLQQTWNDIKTRAITVFTALKETVVSIWESIKNRIKAVVNGIIGVINGMISGVVAGINSLIRLLNNFKVEFPDWVPAIGGKTIGFSLSQINAPKIPTLAQGAVIPPNREFMAILGDQSHGTNVEAPLDTIKQAVAEVMANNGNAEMISLLQQLIAVVESKNLVIGDKEIGKANARYNNKVNLIRGTAI